MARKVPIRQEPIVAAFAEKLRQLRRSHGMTQQDLAGRAQLTESYVSRLEAGNIAPGIDLVAKLAKALGIPIAQLLDSDAKEVDKTRVLKEQAKYLFEKVLAAPDNAFLHLLNQILALIAESVDRQR